MISNQIPRVKNYMKCLVDSIERISWTLLPVAVHFTIRRPSQTPLMRSLGRRKLRST